MHKHFTFYLFLLSVLICVGVNAQTSPPPRTYTSQSVLSTGTWYKLGVTGPGIYKIDKNQLQSLGITSATDPRTIKLYGNGGQILPQGNATSRPDDLTQNAIFVAGEADGKLDDADYILFYAPGPHRWNYNQGQFSHQTNIYSDTAYYFLTAGPTLGKRITLQPVITGATQNISTYTDLQYYEKDQINMLQSGREWYGEAFNSATKTREFTFPISDRAPAGKVSVTAALMSNSEGSSSFTITANNLVLGTQFFAGRGTHDYHEEGENNSKTYILNNSGLPVSEELKINLSYNLNGVSTATGYLNYLEIAAERNLNLRGNQLGFRSVQNMSPGAKSVFTISNVSANSSVWDVTNPLKAKAYALQINNNQASFTAPTDSLREFILFSGSDFPKPVAFGPIANQNLHTLNSDGALDFVIVTNPLFKAQAERLAQHRQTRTGLKVVVVTTNQIYQEFSSGAQDVSAIRDFMKMIYDRSTKKGDNIIYLLLFGDASYDFKSSGNDSKARTLNNTNFVPVYESRESLDPLRTYSSDDYFGLLDTNEGDWNENNFSSPEIIDIGIGRLPAKTVAEATQLVDKIIHYESTASFGKWRKKITLIADDGDAGEHLQDAENLANYLEGNQPNYNLKKIYLDLFKQEAAPNGQRSPVTNSEIDKAIEQGSLITNYTGHGSETGLAHEQIITVHQINGWQNFDRLTFMLTATCEFGRYDDPRRNSGAELSLLNAKGGAVGMLTTTRPVYANSNRVLNRSFIENAFKPIQDKMPRLGDLIRITKNNSFSQINTRNFALLGDPSMQLAYPELKATVTHINNLPVSSVPDTLKALSKITIAGQITDSHNNLVNSFTGKIQITVYEKKNIIKTLGDEWNGSSNNIRSVSVTENIIYDGLATVKNGQYTASFVIPKDIGYQYGFGKINLYASNEETDAQGVHTNVIIGGSDKNIAADNTPPVIRLFMDDESFISGSLTGENTNLIAHLSDDNGINTTGTGIGHEITATLDGDKSKTIVLNNFYSAEENSFKAGSIRYLFKDLEPGLHQITLKAWDTHNNSGEANIQFKVTREDEMLATQLHNFPNPLSSCTTFKFSHNRAGEDLDIQIQIFSVTGKLVKTLSAKRPQSNAIVMDITWDGKDDLGYELKNGLYTYRLIVRSNLDKALTQQYQKLLILK